MRGITANFKPTPASRWQRLDGGGLLIALAVALAVFLPGRASAAAPDLLWQVPADDIMSGSGAGELRFPRGIAADPDTGHLYVADSDNNRISEFTAWGQFVKAWGWDVAPDGAPGDTASDQFEVCTTICKAGLEGNEKGEINSPRGLALDTAGDIYAFESPLGLGARRVQKFNSAGEFLLSFGGRVNKTKVALRESQEANAEPVTVTPAEENLCTAASGDICGAGLEGTADGYFSLNGSKTDSFTGSFITFNPGTGSLFVGDTDRIQEFTTGGVFSGKLDFEGSDLGKFDGKTVNALVADPLSGDLYFSLGTYVEEGQSKAVSNVQRLDPDSGTVVSMLEVKRPKALAVDAEANLYVVDEGGSEAEVLGFTPTGSCIPGLCSGEGFARPVSSQLRIPGLTANVSGPGSNEPGDLYVSYFSGSQAAYIRAYGPPPIAFEDPPLQPPEIRAQYAMSAGAEGALVKAEINPRFWPDTTFRVQYASAACVDAEGWEAACVSEDSPAPGARLTDKSANSFLTTPAVFLGDLQSDTVYHYRFVSQSGGSNGEEVIGSGGKPNEVGAVSSFTTLPTPDAPEDCANQSFRSGSGARLPDCRAYELVSPLDKGNSDILTPLGAISLDQSAPTGNGLTYTSSTSFGPDAAAAPTTSQYLATRDPAGGWLSASLSPPRTREVDAPILYKLKNEFKLFSADLCSSWLRGVYDPPLADGAIAGYTNLYRRQGCAGAGSYEALTTTTPPSTTPAQFAGLELQGVSADGSASVYIAKDSLSPEAPSQDGCGGIQNPCRFQLYLNEAGALSFICILPNGDPVDPAVEDCFAGTIADATGIGDTASLAGAFSTDGRRVFWTSAPGVSGSGRIYVRIDGNETVAVSGLATDDGDSTNDNAFFWGADKARGARAIFEMTAGDLAGDLYSFDVDSQQETLIAEGSLGVMGMSEDATQVYFASSEAIPDSGENNAEEEAHSGEPNLYLWEEGEGARFIGRLSSFDVGGEENSVYPVQSLPVLRSSRVSPDGQHVVFMSTALLAGYDNLDQNLSEPASEVFLYDAGNDELRCISCNRTGARPNGGILPGGPADRIPAAAKIPGWQRSLYPGRLLSDDGSRVFFESFEALVSGDTNGVQDVYQWEEPGAGACDEGDATFNPKAGGCVDLISSGESPQASYFRDASPSGDDVFISTLSSLLPQDYGLIDIYDARVGGGFPQSTETPACEGEACQGPVSAPNDPTPASSSFEGAGNVVEEANAKKKKKASRCPKGKRKVKHKGKVGCQKPKKAKAKHHRKAKNDRRATR